MARDRRTDARAQRTDEKRTRAREERERRRVAKAGVERQAPVAPPLPPPVEEGPSEEWSSPVEEAPHIEEMPRMEGPAPVEGLSVDASSVGVPGDASSVGVPGDAPSIGALPGDAPPINTPPINTPRANASRVGAPPAGAPPVADRALAKSLGVGKPPGSKSRSHRPHLHRPHVPHWRGRVARVVAVLALIVVLGALAVGAVLVAHHSERPKIPPTPAIVKVVIPEGYTRTQIAALSHADGLRGSYLVASKRSAQLRPSRYGAPADTPNLEGFLFPATYELYAGASAARLVSEQLTAFRKNFGGGEVHRAEALGVTPYELLIVASIIEREAAIARDRPLVAAVIYNRLNQDMSLGVDSTLRYALHDFTHPLTETELASNSPYNTRVHKGLPPTPISNPGIAAIKAAARPAHVSYLYYVAGADGCGEQVFSTSYARFERNAAAYHEALRKNGGRVPTCKKR